MNPVNIISNQFDAVGITTQYKRRCKDGSLQDASEKELGLLKIQASIASHSKKLQYFSKDEKNIWAIQMKDYANELYSQGTNFNFFLFVLMVCICYM